MALIAVSAAIAVISAILVEYNYDTDIDYAAAANARDEMRAHYLAVSAMNLSRLVIKVQHDVLDRFRKFIGDVQLADYLPLMIGAFGGGKDEVENLANTIGGIDTANIKGLGLPAGQFDVQVTTDDGKINVNCANGSANSQKQLELMLDALVQPISYNPLFEEKDADGQITDRPTFVSGIIDFVDRDAAKYAAGGNPEDYGYETLPDGYKSRDNYLDSIDELRLVRGMDDRKWDAFGSAFTVYGGCKVNLGAANDLGVIAALLYQAAKDPNDPVLRDPMKLWALAARIAQARMYGVMFADAASFVDFVKNPDAALADLVASAGGPAGAVTGLLAPVEGLELDPAKVGQVARAGGRRTYRVVATAKIGKVDKTITGIWDTDTQNQNARDPAYAKGTWVYWREE